MIQKLRCRQVILPAVVLAACALLAAAVAGALHHDSALATHVPITEVAIDLNVAGNGDNSLGPADFCSTGVVSIGGTLDIDVVVRGVPEFRPDSWAGHDGIAGFAFNLLFDPAVVQVLLVQAFDGPTILKAGGAPNPFVFIDYDGTSNPPNHDPPPGTTGNVRIDVGDLSQKFEHGDGVLTRITLQAVGPGTSSLTVRDTFTWPWQSQHPTILDARAERYSVGKTTDAVVHVGGGECPPAPPAPVLTPRSTMPPTAPPTPTAVPTPVPTPPIVGDAELRIGGASVHEGETFEVNLEASVDPPGVGYYFVQVHYPQFLLTVLSCTALTGTQCGIWGGKGKVWEDAVLFNRQVFPDWEGLTGQLQLGTIRFRAGELKGAPETTALLSISTLKFEAPFFYSGRFDLKTVNGEVKISLAPTPSPFGASYNTEPPAAGVDDPAEPAASVAPATGTPGAPAAGGPAALPSAGGRPATGSGSTPELATVAIGAGLVLTAGGSAALLRWGRRRRGTRH